jgi:benzoyl-CoA reductase subunit C
LNFENWDLFRISICCIPNFEAKTLFDSAYAGSGIAEMELFKPFLDIVQDRHGYAKGWKARTGGKVIGYFCTYVPEEIIYAAGMLPVRIIGNNESQTITDEYCSRNKWCPFSL